MMNVSIEHMIAALQAPTMEAVIALSERTQTLQCNPTGFIYSFYRSIDQTLIIGYSDQLDQITAEMMTRDFQLMASRRGTRREDKLTRQTLAENNILGTYGEQYFNADRVVLQLLQQLNWPLGDLTPSLQSGVVTTDWTSPIHMDGIPD